MTGAGRQLVWFEEGVDVLYTRNAGAGAAAAAASGASPIRNMGGGSEPERCRIILAQPNATYDLLFEDGSTLPQVPGHLLRECEQVQHRKTMASRRANQNDPSLELKF